MAIIVRFKKWFQLKKISKVNTCGVDRRPDLAQPLFLAAFGDNPFLLFRRR